MFFDNHDFHDFRDRCELAGIMPVTAELADGARFPAKLIWAFQRAGLDPAAIRQAGIHYAAAQCSDLLHHGVAGLHFYTLKQADATLRICERIGLADRASAA